MIDWRVGGKLVCVRFDGICLDDEGQEHPTDGIIVGEIYTLSDIGPEEHFGYEPHECTGGIWVELQEFPEEIYLSECFEKTIDKKSATELFERLCRDATREMEKTR